MVEPSAFPAFKRATLEDNSIGNKKRAWKSLKQILAIERTLQWPDNAITCKCFNGNENKKSFSISSKNQM